ncbi:MAG: glycosyltransferase family 4 protein [Rhodospirillaceae bacterium]|nr:glycosyltransferase family 4 protein [Rhodospirillaceae bacterium]
MDDGRLAPWATDRRAARTLPDRPAPFCVPTRKPRVLVLTRYTATAASSRVRHFAFIPALREAGYDITVDALLDDRQIAAAHGHARRPLARLLVAYCRRLWRLLRHRWDLVWVEKEVWPYVPILFERVGLARGCHTILDIDDAWYLRYENSSNALVRLFLAEKIVRLARSVDRLTVPNSRILRQLELRGAPGAAIVGPYVDVGPFAEVLRRRPENVPPVVGWIGTPLTAEEYLPIVAPALNRLSAAGHCRVVLVGAGAAAPALVGERRPWVLEREAEDVATFDLMVMPLRDDQWAQAKSGYKVLLSFAAGVPVVVSRVGSAQDLVTEGEDGLLVDNTPEQWSRALESLAGDAERRRRMGAAGRAKIDARYGFDRALGEVLSMFEATIGRNAAAPSRADGGPAA